MTAKIIDGKAIAYEIELEVRDYVVELRKSIGRPPCLAVVLITNDDASKIYVARKQQACERVGITSILTGQVIKTQLDLEVTLQNLSCNRDVDGILLQLPLPKVFGDPAHYFDFINPKKDVDVFHPENVGLLVQGRPRFLPCTPHGIQIMLSRSGLSVKGKHVVVISRSNIIGRPLSSMLIQDNDEYANATVTVCHDNTPPEQLKRITKQADIVVVAVGKSGFLKGDMLAPGSVVMDVGINRMNGKIVGDVDISCQEVAGWISKVPGGVGLLTISCLMKNTFLAAKMLSDLL